MNKNIIRWILVLPAAIVGWYIAFFIAVMGFSYVESVCPFEQSGPVACTLPWYLPSVDALIVLGASLSAVTTMLAATWTAPTRHPLVAIVIFIGGAGVALSFALSTSAWPAFAGAFICGLITLAVILFKQSQPVSR